MKKRKLLWICIPALVFLLITGALETGRRFDLSGFWPEKSPVLVEGRIFKTGHTSNSSTIYLKDISILSEADGLSANLQKELQKKIQKSRVLVYLKEDDGSYSIGDYVRISGECVYPKAPMNPGGFDGQSYYGAQHIVMMLRKGVIVNKAPAGSWFYHGIQRIQNSIVAHIDASADGVEGAILKSVLLGDKADLDADVKKVYQDNGIIHVLAISGLHISMIGMVLYQFLRRLRLSFPVSSLLSAVLIVLYGFLTGFPTSAVRAIIMFLIYLGSQIAGRTYDQPNALCLACVLVLFLNPLNFSQMGFLLSFGAVLGVLSKDLFHTEFISGSAFGVSFCVWLMTLPVVACSYHQVPLGGILLNLVVVPSMTFIMALGILGTVCSFLSESIAGFLFGPVHYMVSVTVWLGRLLRRIPGMVWITGTPAAIQIAAYYALLYGGLWLTDTRWFRNRLKDLFYLDFMESFMRAGLRCRKRITALIRGLMVLLAVLVLFWGKPEGFSITFLNVGQGDGICIRTENRNVYMVDGGSSSESNLGSYTLEPYLKYMGYSSIKGWFVSHYDHDHVSGLIQMLEEYEPDFAGGNANGITIENIFLPALETEEELERKIIELAKKNQIHVHFSGRGDLLKDGMTEFRIISPVREEFYEDSNAGSMVMKVTYKDFDVLLTGDVQGEGEKGLLEVDLGDVDVLKVAHHGSRNSSGMEVLQHIDPETAVISCGKDNRYGHPNDEVLERLEDLGCMVLRTDETGIMEWKVR